MEAKVLLVDDTIDPPKVPSRALGADFRRYIPLPVEVRRAPERDLPRSIEGYSHIILSGSKTSILEDAPWIEELSKLIRSAIDARVPLLGVCYGHQMIARVLGGKSAVRRAPKAEVGWYEIDIVQKISLFDGLNQKKIPVFQSHFDEVVTPPPYAVVAARSERCAVQAYALPGNLVFGVQFHPERNFEEGEEAIDFHIKKRTSTEVLRRRPVGNREDFARTITQIAETIFGNFAKCRRT